MIPYYKSIPGVVIRRCKMLSADFLEALTDDCASWTTVTGEAAEPHEGKTRFPKIRKLFNLTKAALQTAIRNVVFA